MSNKATLTAIQNSAKENFEAIHKAIPTLMGSFSAIDPDGEIDRFLKNVIWQGQCFLLAIDFINRINDDTDKRMFLSLCEGILTDSVILLKYPDQHYYSATETMSAILFSPKLQETFFPIIYSINAITLCTKMMMDSIKEKPTEFESSVSVRISQVNQTEVDLKDGMQYLIKVEDGKWVPVLFLFKEKDIPAISVEPKPLVLMPGDMTNWMVNQIGEGMETNSINAVWNKLIEAAPKIEDYSDGQLFEILDRINDELSKRFPRTNLITHKFAANVQMAVVVKDMKPIPPETNPFKHDNVSSGVDISNQWTIMFANDGKYSMYLCNNFSGQRISLTFVPKDLSLREPII